MDDKNVDLSLFKKEKKLKESSTNVSKIFSQTRGNAELFLNICEIP